MGFFTTSELNKQAQIIVDINQLESQCTKCGLYKKSDHPKIDISGEGRKKILIIGEFSSETEDMYGTAFSGESGSILQTKLKFQNISLNKDCWKINAVRCKVPDGKVPSQTQIHSCHPHLKKLILTLKPKLILLMGNIAINSLFGDTFSNRKVARWRTYCIPDEVYGCNIVPLFDIKYVNKYNKDKNLESTFDRDLKHAIKCLNKPFVKRKDYEGRVTTLLDFKRVKTFLKRIIKRKPTIAYDYETTGLKPFRKGHKIVTIGVAISPKKAFTFPYQWKQYWTKVEFLEIKKLWKIILKDNDIKKITANQKYEEVWSTVMFNSRPDCIWDTMMGAHIMDNRSASTGLKFQTFVNFGVRPYDEHIKPFLQSKDGEFNTVEKAPFKDLLLYNGLDCIFTYMLFKIQYPFFLKRRKLFKAYMFFQRGNKQMATLQLNGINMNSKYYQKAEKQLEKKINKRKKYLESGREARKFQKKYKRPIKITSNQDLGKLFYEVLGKDPIYTDKGQYKTDKATLEGLNLPFVKKLLEMKKYEKAKGTYLGQFAREIYRNKLYPFFDLNIPVSFRSSSSRPNWQNLPKRDEEIKTLIRKGIIPGTNSVLSEIDFSGAEVIVSATEHKDPTFINYLLDPTTDMHRDSCSDLLQLPHDMLENPNYNLKQKKLVKKLRFFAKNNWTFAQFYGDWFGSCAPTFWENVIEAGLKLPNGMTCRKWLETKGIYELGEMTRNGPTPFSFMEHCAKVEDKMWNERFPVYTAWKKQVVQDYQETGFIENHFGFRFTGYMSKNQCTNFPIQSCSFHLLLYTLIEVQKFIDKNKLKTKLIGQIHDSLISSIPKNEIQIYTRGVTKIVQGLQKKFKWLIIPMEVEIELSRLKEVNGNFSDMREFSMKDINNKKYLDFICNPKES